MRTTLWTKAGWPAFGGALLALALLAHTPAGADKGLNEGIYRDRDGKAHSWSLSRSHLLTWNEKPYVPAGLVFHSAFLRSPSEETFAADEATLDRYKAAGVLDVWIEPDRGLLGNPVAATQRLVDALEARGFRYGLRVGDRSRDPLIGFAPSLAQIRVPTSRMQPGARERFVVDAPSARRAVYALVESPDRKTQYFPVATGDAVAERGKVEISLQLKNSKLLGKRPGSLLVVPEIQVEPEDIGSFGDMWQGMERYNQRLKSHLQAVKFGPGLRFLLDPFAAGDGTVGQEDRVFPSSPEFHRAFGDWLSRKYGIARLNIAWRLTDRRIPGEEEASRLVPMWPRNDPPEGDGWLYDPVEHVAYQCDPAVCSIWSDMEEFRAESLRRWMNVLTVGLKQEGLNVPTLFTWSAYHPVFTNSPSPAGYDGLAAQLYGGESQIQSNSIYALGQVEEADRETWLIAARVAGPVDAEGRAASIGVDALKQAWTGLRQAGYRGLFVDPRQVTGAETALAGLIDPADPLYRQTVKALFFPITLASADRATRLATGVWWLPSGNPARMLRYGDSILGYEIQRPFGEDHVVRQGTVMWSTAGKQEVSFFVDKVFPVELYDSAGQPMKFKKKPKDLIAFTLTEDPVVAVGSQASTMFPVELARSELQEFDALLRQAEAQRLDSATLRSIYTEMARGLGPNSAAAVYASARPYVERLRQELAPFLWLEGERAVSHNLTGNSFQAACSGGMYLKLDRSQPPISGVLKASYLFDIRRDASYEIWVAGKVPGKNASPLIWQVDDEPAVPLNTVTAVGGEYAPGIEWYQLGRLTLKTGRHELRLVFPDKAANGRYVAGIDAVVLSRDVFQPRGIERPVNRRFVRPLPSEDDDKPEREKPGREKPEREKPEKDTKGKGKGRSEKGDPR